jgi:RNA polymerase sporulation-specific sigma factor
MLSSAFMLLMSGAFLMLRLGTSGGSFPRPLTTEEERYYVERWLEGDIEARNVLIEHNLRLVAHIIKKYYTQAEDADDLISIGTIGLIRELTHTGPTKEYASRLMRQSVRKMKF